MRARIVFGVNLHCAGKPNTEPAETPTKTNYARIPPLAGIHFGEAIILKELMQFCY